MQNLEQLRASHALSEAPKTDKASAAKLPAMVLSNGLLATLAFASESDAKTKKPKRDALNAAVTSIARHLSQPAVGLPELNAITTPQALSEKLSKGEALTLQRATTEALAYLSYLKRYAPKKD